jgi:Tol biopolymer transport system component
MATLPSRPCAANNEPQSSRRRFLERVSTVCGALVFEGSNCLAAQDAFDRGAVDESLRGRLIFGARPKSDPENTGLFAYDFETRKWRRVFDGAQPESFCRASPDGKSFAVMEGPFSQTTVSILGPGGRTKIGETRGHVFWAPDSRQVVLSEWDVIRGKETATIKSKTWRMNVDGTGRVQLPVPDSEVVFDWSPDGRWFLTGRTNATNVTKRTLLIRRADGTDPRPLIDEKDGSNVWPGRFSPDSQRIAYARIDQQHNESSLWVIEVATRLERRILEGNAEGHAEDSPCWSPDGKYFALLMTDRTKRTLGREIRIEILDLQGNRIRQLGIPHKYPLPCNWL